MAEIVGHRGAAGLAPENTLPSFRRAVELGVRLLELDVRLTRDGVPVCMHDDRLDRTTAATGRVTDWDSDRLSQVPAMPGAFGGAFPDARVPTLEAVLAGLPAGCRVLVEVKADPERAEELVHRTVETISRAGARDRCRLISFEQDLLRLARDAGLPLGVIVGGRDRETLLPRAREVGAFSIPPHQSLVDEAF